MMIFPLHHHKANMHPTMAATEEELLRLIEPAPPSPSIFSDNPLTINGDTQLEQPRDDLALAYISRMLMDMEEDIVDKFFCQYPDHPTLLQAEQPFAEILYSSGTTSADAQESSALLSIQGNSTGIMISNPSGQVHNPTLFLNGTVIVEEPSNGTGMGMLSSMAFFKGMEEANRFLPTNNRMVDGRGRKNRLDMDGETEACMGRSSKQIAVRVRVHTDSVAEDNELEIDLLILNGYNMYPSEMLKETGDKAPQQSICRKAPHVRRRARQMMVAVDLETLLIRCAEAVATNDQRSTGNLLELIKRHSSSTGDATQRLAHYFAEGLEARLVGKGRQLYHSITMANLTCTMELLKSYHLCMAASCCLKVSLNFSNKNIYNAVAGRKKLHIVQYGVNHGIQWPELLRWLAEREGGPPEVRITGIISPQPGFCPAKQAKEAKRMLSYCAEQFGVPFKFHAIVAKLEGVRAEDLDVDPDEVLIVNNMFHFRTLMDESLAFDTMSPRDLVLNNISKMKPSMFIHAAVNGAYSSPFFMTRFRQALTNFTTQFDMMETTITHNKDKRLLVERHIFARSAMNIIACEGADRVERAQNYKEWQARNQRAGLRQLPLDPDIVKMLKDQVRKQYHKNFLISEDQRWLLLGWKGRVLYALSTWVSDDANGLSADVDR